MAIHVDRLRASHLYLIGLWITPKWCPTTVHTCYMENIIGFVAGRSAYTLGCSVLKSLRRAISGDALIPVKDSCRRGSLVSLSPLATGRCTVAAMGFIVGAWRADGTTFGGGLIRGL
jgi:hypothetical protein